MNDDPEWERFMRQVAYVNLLIAACAFGAIIAGLWALDHWS